MFLQVSDRSLTCLRFQIATMAVNRGRTAVINNFAGMWLGPLVAQLSDSIGRKRLMMMGRAGTVVFFCDAAPPQTSVDADADRVLGVGGLWRERTSNPPCLCVSSETFFG